MQPEKQEQIGDETKNYFIAFAKSLGLDDVAEELREICAKITNP
jgi:hypothetical protein